MRECMNEELRKELQREILKQINLPILHQNELKDITIEFDKTLEKISKLPNNLQTEAARLFLVLLIKYRLINI